MKLQTNIPLEPASKQFGYEDQVLLLGSCFAENIGNSLLYHKFQSVVNPHGILFHPLAIERVLQDVYNDSENVEDTVFEIDGIWKSFIAHSRLNSGSKGAMVDKLKEAQEQLTKAIAKASHVFITLGTAWIYQHNETGIAVANCHKVPQKQFVKGLLPIEETTASLKRQCAIIQKINPKASIVFTVSPVRHLKDGFVENMRSKAHLISAVHQACEIKGVQYFPAYELMMDELRDYRFYATDMLHPSQQAIDYIWERFLEVYAFAKAKTTLKEVQSIQQGLSHRPFNANSEQHQEFLRKLKVRIANLQQEYSHIKF
ncbi:hypothetical protein GCM10011344_19760 [Dokdonia pacifica]|uniref:Lysophospholipase L1 n=1 Tax=Dokdonia pacifica TaxID=1627892 RepID=A0A238VPH3_9FLAO|nr:GSCFA domain-containing protein [Dokdonia pacifica]GGG19207.1 hypothetical protein GCM10011344_19760 [Dokdonia pacifica]SNR36235.1 Lysophospholipase L1 [Dokdonia pacifica]